MNQSSKILTTKIVFIISVLALLLSITSIFLGKSNSDLVYVDVNKLIEGYKKTKIVKGEFDKKVAGVKSNVDSLMSRWQKELQAYEKERTSMSPNEVKLKQELLQNKQNQISGYQESVQKQMLEEEKKVTQTVVNDINEYIKEYGKDHGYKIIFGASGSGNIMYAQEATDLTKDVLNGLNQEYASKK